MIDPSERPLSPSVFLSADIRFPDVRQRQGADMGPLVELRFWDDEVQDAGMQF